MIEKVFVYVGGENQHKRGEEGWVYIKNENCLEETLAVELIEHEAYMQGYSKFKYPYFKSDVVEMSIDMYEKWQNYNNEGDDGQVKEIIKDIINAALVAKCF